MIEFNANGVDLPPINFNKTKDWIIQVIKFEKKQLGDLEYVFCSDDYLHQINVKHLKHNTLTDIITFDYCVDDIIHGEIFISTERVAENAKNFIKTFDNELKRVIIHGVLHLIGYNDKTAEESKQMRAKEDFYLTLLS